MASATFNKLFYQQGKKMLPRDVVLDPDIRRGRGEWARCTRVDTAPDAAYIVEASGKGQNHHKALGV